MVSVGERVKEAIDWMTQGHIAQALASLRIALDVTSQRDAGAKGSEPEILKRFIRENRWLITHVGFPGVAAGSIRVPFTHPDVKTDAAGTVGVEEIIDHVIRCARTPSDAKNSKIVWNKAIALGRDPEGHLVLNEGLFWGLVSAVVFAPVNRSESIPDPYWLQVGPFRMFVSELWGRVDLARRIVRFHTGVEVS